MSMQITKVTYVNGTDVQHLSDQDLFAMIAAQNNELKALNALGISGPAVQANRDVFKKNIDTLTGIVNLRYKDHDLNDTDTAPASE